MEAMIEIIDIVLKTLGGISFILVGLCTYLGKLRLERYKSDLADTQSKLKGLIDSTVHVSKAQFDKEFGIYQEAWKYVAELKAATLTLRDSIGEIMAEITGKEVDRSISSSQLEKFEKALLSLSKCLNENRPFYSGEIHRSLNSIVAHCYVHFDLAKKELDEEGKQDFIESHKQIFDEVNRCCKLIRTRIQLYAV
jgi:hypothetical protein